VPTVYKFWDPQPPGALKAFPGQLQDMNCCEERNNNNNNNNNNSKQYPYSFEIVHNVYV
jgi:hypothetical protein